MSCKIEIDGKVYEGEWFVNVTDNKVYVDGEYVETLGEEVPQIPRKDFWEWIRSVISDPGSYNR